MGVTAKVLLVAVSLVAFAQGDLTWANDFDGALLFECPTDEAIFHIQSIHDNHHEDRIWGYDCRSANQVFSSCFWSGYVNAFDELLIYECQGGAGVITGMQSENNNDNEDRIWNFKCCSTQNTCYKECGFTPYENDWDGPLDYVVPEGYVITGVQSEHKNEHEDRRWKYQTCQVTAC